MSEVDMATQHVLVDNVPAVELHRVGDEVLVRFDSGVELAVESFRVVKRVRRSARVQSPITRRERNRKRLRSR